MNIQAGTDAIRQIDRQADMLTSTQGLDKQTILSVDRWYSAQLLQLGAVSTLSPMLEYTNMLVSRIQ